MPLQTIQGTKVPSVISKQQIEVAVDRAKDLMLQAGIDSDVTYDDFVDWFESEVPVPDIEIGDAVLDPLLVVHELAEIHEVLQMGLELSKEVLERNRDKVWAAHLKALATEMKVAKSVQAAEHMKSRLGTIQQCCMDSRLPSDLRSEYRKLLQTTKRALSDLKQQGAPSSSIRP